MKILQILAHPDYNNKNRISNLLAELGKEELRKKYSNITTLNLYDPKCYIPIMDKHMFNYDGKELTKQEEADKIRQEELLNIWKNSDCVFIYMPLHNFNVVSKFKDFIDNIVIVNETFKCEIETMVGLDNTNKQVTFVITSGGEFDSHIQYVNLDFAVQYVRGVFSVIGINKVKIIRSQGLDLVHNDKQAIVENTKEELIKHINSL
ncbi:NAD(P)H-dependent oxidoreductase [Gemella sanguinis]|uniref:NAD(P)H-dependent oxidoreductase n=1 Tax=Gemella sanguinis TaxID=84135 RepID=UPI0026F2F993|nr:NAD(P)H-dependent oxidoreductase [Gemella sanguinis]